MFKAIIAAATIGLMASQATAGCLPRAKMVQGIKKDLGEDIRVRGLTSDGKFILEMFVNEEKGTWRIALTGANGSTCIVASGTAFQWADIEPAGTDG